MSSDDHSPLVPGSNAIPCGHSCLPAEIKRCIDAKLPLPDKIYIQIDGASDNAIPWGHSHEDIDRRFHDLFATISDGRMAHAILQRHGQ